MTWMWFAWLLWAPQAAPEQNPYTSEADVSAGRQFYLGHCAQCHGPDGEGGRGINLTTGRYRLSRSDGDLLRTILGGIPGTEMPGSRLPQSDIWKIVAYLRRLGAAGALEKASGDPRSGDALYRRTGCSQCHQIAGRGGSLGPPLDEIGLRRSLRFLRESLTRPEVYIPRDFEGVRVVTRAGEQIIGVRLNEDDYSIQIRTAREELRSFWKRELREVRPLDKSLMPAYGAVFSPAELEDLVAYLSSLRGNP